MQPLSGAALAAAERNVSQTTPQTQVARSLQLGGNIPATTPTAPATTPATSGPYTIKSGDTLSQIAQRQGTSVKELMRLNPQLSDPNKIRAGATLNVAGAGRESTYAGGVGAAPMPRASNVPIPTTASTSGVSGQFTTDPFGGIGPSPEKVDVTIPTQTKPDVTYKSLPTQSTQSDGTAGEEAGRLAAQMPPSAPIRDADAEKEANIQKNQAATGTQPIMTGAGGVLQSGSGAPINSPAPGADSNLYAGEGKYSNNSDRMLTELKDIVRLAGFKK
jgi:LysM repeat protein